MEQQFTTFQSIQDSYQFLQKLGASPRLMQHVKLVGEAAEMLILQFQKLGISFDPDWIRLGVIFHDVGKILHPSELIEKGHEHEAAGEMLLLSQGVDPKIARCCRSHGQWQKMECDFEELVVALADNLWKGKRNTELENNVIAKVVKMCDQDYWSIFVELDSGFEKVAAGGDLRLSRSVAP
jgi:putative nucleotidyltransferase with HDIG domain